MGKLALQDVQSDLADLFGKLSGSDASIWCEALNKFLRKKSPCPTVGYILANVTLGTHKTVGELENAILQEGNKIPPVGSEILRKVVVAQEQIELELVAVTGGEFGFEGLPVRDKIYTKAKSLGLRICPAEVGPQLRRVFQNQRMGDRRLWIAMEPISDSKDVPQVFVLECRKDNSLWLSAAPGYRESYCSLDDVWVFVRPAAAY